MWDRLTLPPTLIIVWSMTHALQPIRTTERQSDCGVAAIAAVTGLTTGRVCGVIHRNRLGSPWNLVTSSVLRTLYAIGQDATLIAGGSDEGPTTDRRPVASWVPANGTTYIVSIHINSGWHWVACRDGIIFDTLYPQGAPANGYHKTVDTDAIHTVIRID